MNPSDSSQSKPAGLVSIERVVAFILGPSIAALSGWLSTLLAKKWGIKVEGAELAGIFSAGVLAATALVYKWLHGRQVEMGTKTVEKVGLPGGELAVGDLAPTSISDLEGLASNAATQAVESVGTSPDPDSDLGPPLDESEMDAAPVGDVTPNVPAGEVAPAAGAEPGAAQAQ